MPTRQKGESKDDFLQRCMGDSKMGEEFSDSKQRYAVCVKYSEEEVSAGMEDYIFSTKEGARKKSMQIGFDGKIHSDTMADGTVLYFPGPDEKTFQEWFDKNDSHEAQETLEALQYGRPGKNDPRKTPAKPSERRKGSKRNKPGSAKKPNKSITFSKETEARLRSLMQEHNKKGKGSKASMGMLKTVYRRGAGAFSRSHAPNMSRGGWGIARVKAFLYLLRNGRPSNPNYKQDNDLLPKSHPRAQEEYIFMKSESGYDSMDYQAAEYKGRKVTLNKPFRTQGGPKKFAVYVQNESGRVVIVRFGDPNMEIKRDDPNRRRNFRSRHSCDTPGPKTKARYWSCKMWERSKSVTDYTSEELDIEELDLTYEELWEQNEEQPLFEDIEEVEAEEDCGCGCGDCGETVEAKMIRKDTYDNPGEAQGRAKELGLEGIHTLEEDGETYFMPGKTHEEYMKKVGEEKEVEGYHHDEKKKASYHEGDSCPAGQEMKNGKCVRVAVTLDATINNAEAIVEAKTGKSVVKISGIAFHEGMNKNGWEITRQGAENVISQMVGADITLNHPKAEHGRFKRNMAGLDEGVVGIIESAKIVDAGEKWEVHFVGSVERSELFEVLESGLWLREGYGVSIGGTGVPDKIVEAADGKTSMVFETDFTFDHLAIVHKPAYPRAKITDAVKTEKALAEETLKCSMTPAEHQQTVNKMTEEEIKIEASEDLSSKMAEMEKALVLANSRVAEFEAAENARKEEERMAIVKEASEMGLKGHESLPSETIKELMASWEASRPAIREMKPVEHTPENAVASVQESTAVVANYLNGKMLRTPEAAYKASFNSLVAAYNRGAGTVGRAPTYEEAKQKGLI